MLEKLKNKVSMKQTAQQKKPFFNGTLLALAVSAFAIGTAEFVMAGILPDIATSLSVSIAAAGWLMTAYALGVFISAPIIILLTTRLSRKTVLILLLSFFIVGNLLSALAPNYSILMLGRVIAALAHGAFFGIGSVVAADSVSKQKRSRAIALMMAGLTLANVLGVPMGTLIGYHLGWQATFFAVSVLGIVSFIGINLLVPHQPRQEGVCLKTELALFRKGRLWFAWSVTALGFGGLFAAFAFSAPILIHVSGFKAASISWLLIVFGAGLVLGNILGGKWGDMNYHKALQFSLLILALLLIVFHISAHWQVAATINLFLLGVFGFAIVSPVQTQVLENAKGVQVLASASNISAFNVGIALGTYLGGLAIHIGMGYLAVTWIGAGLALASFLIQCQFLSLVATNQGL